METLGNLLQKQIEKARTPKKYDGLHSELHGLIHELRTEYGETAKTGPGSFGFYLGKLRRVPLQTIYMWRSEIRQSRDAKNRGKLFWWKYKQWKKPLSKSNPPRAPVEASGRGRKSLQTKLTKN